MLPARANPFRVDRLHGLRIRLPGETVAGVVDRFIEAGCYGALVGPHGTGKTTLIEEMLPLLRLRGYPPARLRLNEEDHPHVATRVEQWLSETAATQLLVLDGAEQLGFFQWRRFKRQALRYAGLLITTHRPGRLPTLLRTDSSVQLLAMVVRELVPDNSLSPLFLTALFRRHRGNLRDCLRELYDLWDSEGLPASE